MFKINPIIFKNSPTSIAIIKGSEKYPKVNGCAKFYRCGIGTVVLIEVFELPRDTAFFAVHIHNKKVCSCDIRDLFEDTGTHLAFENQIHPFHTGDLISIPNNSNGYSWSIFYTEKFNACEIKNYPIVIHRNADDFRTQPSGNSGEKMAIGVIK